MKTLEGPQVADALEQCEATTNGSHFAKRVFFSQDGVVSFNHFTSVLESRSRMKVFSFLATDLARRNAFAREVSWAILLSKKLTFIQLDRFGCVSMVIMVLLV